MHTRKSAQKALAKARRRARRLGLEDGARQILLCYDLGTSKCASKKRMRQSWKFLKKRLKELNLDKHGGILRTKTSCLEICSGGPIVVIYPDGVWYGGCDPPVLEKILEQHLLGGRIVKEFVLAQSPGCA